MSLHVTEEEAVKRGWITTTVQPTVTVPVSNEMFVEEWKRSGFVAPRPRFRFRRDFHLGHFLLFAAGWLSGFVFALLMIH